MNYFGGVSSYIILYKFIKGCDNYLIKNMVIGN